MKRPGSLLWSGILLLASLAPSGLLAGDDEAETDASTAAFRKAVDLQRKGRWVAARKAFRDLLEKYPETIHYEEAEARSGDNAYLGTVKLLENGPPDRRIDVSVMGDGFTIDSRDQALQAKWAKLCVNVLLNEKSTFEYQDYFNFHFVRLASLEEGVDPQLSEEQRAKIEERNRRRARKRKTQYDTALDCKAAGPQGQVAADRGLVYRWLAVAEADTPGCGDDGLVIAFARFGKLGMGGGGVANVGRPDKSITAHEFGHAFVGLLDEYAVNPMKPSWPIRAANAASTDDPAEVPWAHFLARKVKGVGIYEGGATYKQGVWRPARSCVMNAAGAGQYCPVCREANVLAIYGYVNPVEEVSPDPVREITAKQADRTVLTVVVMRPRTHVLEVTWRVRALDEGESPPSRPTGGDDRAEWWRRRMSRSGMTGYSPGKRAMENRDRYDQPPPGEVSRLGKASRGRRPVHTFPVGRLDPGRYLVTAVVRDATRWVIEDPRHLLEERVSWTVTIEP